MNSMSRYYKDDCDPCKKGRKDYYDDYDEHYKKEKDCKTIVKCGCPSSTTIPAATVAGTAFTVASLSLNTSSLNDPCIKLEFASNLVEAIAFTGTLTFQVFKQCGNQLTATPVGPAWTFSDVAILSSKTFSFFICDCDSCFNDCCTYTVVATVNSAVTVGTLAINNATLGAIATCGTNSHC